MAEINVPASITADELKQTAPQLTAQMTDQTIMELVKDATVNALADGFPQPDGDKWNDITVLAIKYLTLHMASMDGPAGQGITSEQVAVLKRTYESKIGKDWLHSSVWGLLYYRLWKLYGAGNDRYTVIEH